jgi:hypothetical protein
MEQRDRSPENVAWIAQLSRTAHHGKNETIQQKTDANNDEPEDNLSVR